MSTWLAVGLLGGIVGLDTTSFPQVMISRPFVAGTLTGALFGRPLEGAAFGFVMEAFALITLPIGAARYPESGTATVAGAGAYMAAIDTGLDPGALVLALTFALAWEWLAGETVVQLRHGNGRLLARPGGVSRDVLERRHLAAMTMDFVRGGVMAGAGGLLAYGLLSLLDGRWGLPDDATLGAISVLTATMIGTTLSLFGGAHARRLAWGVGVGTGLVLMVLL